MKKFFITALFLIGASVLCANSAKYMKYGNYYYSKAQYDKAVRYYEYVLKSEPNNPKALMYCAYAYMKSGNSRKAAEYFEKTYKATGNKKFKQYSDRLGGVSSLKGEKSNVWSGGEARLAGMGMMDVVVPDAASTHDLYNEGFTAALSKRPKQNVIYAGPGIINFSNTKADTVEIMGFTATTTTRIGSTGFGLNPYGMDGISGVYWINDNMAVALKPMILSQPVSVNIDISSSLAGMSYDYDIESGGTMLLGESEFMYRLSDSISAGIMLGYSGISFNYSVPDIGGMGSMEEDVSLSKPEYFLSGAYSMKILREFDLTLALGAGVKGGNPPVYFNDPAFFSGGSLLNDKYLIAGYSVKSETTETISGNTLDTVREISMGGFDIMLGAGLKSEKSEIAVSAGATMGRAGTSQSETEAVDSGGNVLYTASTDKYDAYKDGGGIMVSTRSRTYFGPVNIGTGLNYASSSLSYFESESDAEAEVITTGLFEITAGAALTMLENLIIPVEFYLKNSEMNSEEAGSLTEQASSEWGIRAGAEYKLSKVLAVRAGLDYSNSGSTEKTVSGGAVVYDNSPYGTEDNPGYTAIGISAGGGYKLGAAEINAAIRYEMTSQSPLSASLDEYSQGELYFLTGIFIYL